VTFSGFIAILKAIPQLVEYFKQLGALIEKLDLERDIKEIQEVTDELQNADSLKARVAAAKRLTAITKRL
jgi:hypothetical protein